MAETITNLHPDGDENTNLYPNIKKENIPNKSITTNKLDDDVLSLIGSLKPSGTDTSANILAFTSNKGIYVATDTGHWYYWNGDKYVDSGMLFQATEIADGSISLDKLKNNLQEKIIDVELNKEIFSNTIIDYNECIRGFYINGQNQLVENSSYVTTGYIKVKPGETLIFSENCYGFYYDEEKNFIPGVITFTGGTSFTIPQNCYYLRVYFTITYGFRNQLSYGNVILPLDNYRDEYIPVKNINPKILQDNIVDILDKKNIAEGVAITNGYNSNGVYHENSAYVCTDYIDIKDAVYIDVRYNNSDRKHIEFFDKDKNYVLSYNCFSEATPTGHILVPNGAEYIRFDTRATHQDYIYISKTLKLVDNKILKNDLSEYLNERYDNKNLLANCWWTDGYYLGGGIPVANSDYCYSSLIRIDENKKIKLIAPKGEHGRQSISFYDKDNNFISVYHYYYQSNKGETTAPNNAYYFRFDCSVNDKNYYSLYSTELSLKSNNYIIVDKNGNGDFTTLTDAMNSVPIHNDIPVNIIVMPGIYDNEIVDGTLRYANIIGLDRQNCIIKNSYGLWTKCPINAPKGSIQNLTIIAEEPSTPQTETHGYAIHVENNELYNSNLTIKNCYLENYTNHAFGMGMRGGCTVLIENCYFKAHNGYAPIYVHDASNEKFSGTQNVIFRNCQMINVDGGAIARFDSEPVSDSVVNITFNNCLLRDLTDLSNDSVYVANVGTHTEQQGWLGLYHFNLTLDSWGNNFDKFNS